MSKYVAKNPRGNAHMAWAHAMWTCPNCQKTMKAGGKGPHSIWCGVDPAEKFWPKVDRSGGPDACWPWMGARVPAGGYGRFKWTRLIASHRFAYYLANGELPAKLDIMHLCDNPPCCNPAHLRAATTLENMRDAKSKLRHAHGERNRFAKLTADQVRAIRREFREIGRKTNAAELGARYGVNSGTVLAIIRGRAWASVS